MKFHPATTAFTLMIIGCGIFKVPVSTPMGLIGMMAVATFFAENVAYLLGETNE